MDSSRPDCGFGATAEVRARHGVPLQEMWSCPITDSGQPQHTVARESCPERGRMKEQSRNVIETEQDPIFSSYRGFREQG